MGRVLMACIVCWFVLFFVGSAAATELARRPVFGAALTPEIPEATRKAQHIGAGEGVLIVGVLPGLSAEGAGLKVGDIVLTLDKKSVSSVPHVQAVVRARRVGDTITISYVREGLRNSAMLQLKGMPFETASDFNVLYDAVPAGASIRRVIITRPRDAGRHPAVLLIGGIGCYSFDAPLNENDAYRQLLAALTRSGFVTLRVEKSGMGDSTGAPCSDVDMQTEADGYVAGLRMLSGLDYVDASRRFILGHSIGGVVGPIVAAKEPVRGLLVMETVGLTWFEYELANTRRQLRLGGATPREVGAQMLLKEWCMHRLLIDRAARATILKSKPDCADHMVYPASDVYLQQVAVQNLSGLWAGLKGVDVAVVYGAADFVTSVDESKAVVEAANAVRADAADYIEIPDMDHHLVQASDQAASLARVQSGGPGLLHPGLAKIVADWLAKKAA